jgi:glycosyltransferase involved in cell wall biosynthesis
MGKIKQKVLILTNIIAPYRIPLFNFIADQNIFEFKVMALAEIEKNRDWQINKSKIKFDYDILEGWQKYFLLQKRELTIHLNKGIFKKIKEFNPDIVITSGYDSLAYWQAFFYCKVFKRKFILWNETTLLSVGNIKGLKGMLKRIIINGADKYIAFGTKAREYLEYFDAKSKDIFLTINTVDMDHFRYKVTKYRNSSLWKEKRKHYPEVLFLYVGRLIMTKGVLQILKALEELKDIRVGLMVVGSGPEENNLKQYCKENGLRNIYFKGFKQIEELPEYYSLADVFILPSFQEVWGLVENEALASGLYVLGSKNAGASYDLIESGWNGEIFEPNNIQEIVELIKKTIDKLPDIKSRRDEISKNASEKFNINKSAEVFIDCIQSIIN